MISQVIPLSLPGYEVKQLGKADGDKSMWSTALSYYCSPKKDKRCHIKVTGRVNSQHFQTNTKLAKPAGQWKVLIKVTMLSRIWKTKNATILLGSFMFLWKTLRSSAAFQTSSHVPVSEIFDLYFSTRKWLQSEWSKFLDIQDLQDTVTTLSLLTHFVAWKFTVLFMAKRNLYYKHAYYAQNVARESFSDVWGGGQKWNAFQRSLN